MVVHIGAIWRIRLDVHVKLLSSLYVVYCCQDGFTALTLAAKEGFIEICNMLLEHDAYVNLPDRVLLCV